MNILAVGSHPDDIELGCAGTLVSQRKAGHKVHMLVMTYGTASFALGSTHGVRRQEQLTASDAIDSYLWWGSKSDDCRIIDGHETIAEIERIINTLEPGIVFVHAPDDTHQDHRAVANATISAARKVPSVLHYQSPSTRHFDPSVFVDITDTIDDKVTCLACHASQVSTGIVDAERVTANALYWGHFAKTRYAEAFMPSRLLWSL